MSVKVIFYLTAKLSIFIIASFAKKKTDKRKKIKVK